MKQPGRAGGAKSPYANTTAMMVQTRRNATMRSALLEKSHSNMEVSVLSES
jgi:hypothetical protein